MRKQFVLGAVLLLTLATGVFVLQQSMPRLRQRGRQRATPEQAVFASRHLRNTQRIVIGRNGRTNEIVDAAEIAAFVAATECEYIGDAHCGCLGETWLLFVDASGVTNRLNYKSEASDTHLKFYLVAATNASNPWNGHPYVYEKDGTTKSEFWLQGTPSSTFQKLVKRHIR